MPEITQKLKSTFGIESDEFNVTAAKEFYCYVHQMVFTLCHKTTLSILFVHPVENTPLTW
jgi:hypothetical protein